MLTRHTFLLQAPQALDVEPLPVDIAEMSSDAPRPVPEWVNILPAPDGKFRIKSRDYRTLVIEDMQALVDRSNAALKKQGGGGPVDADHRLYGGWFETGGGPVLGWAEEFKVRDGAIDARTDWLAEGRDDVSSGKYRYTSAVVTGTQAWVEDDNGFVTGLDIFPDIIEGFAITNTPALVVTAMFTTEENAMDRENRRRALIKFCGLTEEQAEHALTLPTTKLQQMFTEAKPATQAEPSAEEADDEDDGSDDGADADADGPKDQVNDAAPKLAPIESTELAALRAENAALRKSTAEDRVQQLVHDGKVTPAMRPAALALALSPGGIDHLNKLYANAPRIVPVGDAAPRQKAKATDAAAPSSCNPRAFELAGQNIPAHEIARRLRAEENAQ